jgi:hypothetical protein
MPNAFDPTASTSLAFSTTSAEVTTLSASDNIVRIYNGGTGVVFIRWGTTAQTAVATDMAIAPGAVEVFTKNNATRLAAIASSGSGTLYITTGNGQ